VERHSLIAVGKDDGIPDGVRRSGAIARFDGTVVEDDAGKEDAE